MFSRLFPPLVIFCFTLCLSGCVGRGCGCGSGFSLFGIFDKCSTIEQGAIPAPSGTYLSGWQALQAEKAEADDFVIYNYEWYMGKEELGPFGNYHIGEIAKRMIHSDQVVMIQTSEHKDVDQARLEKVVSALAMAGVPDAPNRVLVGYPRAEGIYGEEAPQIYGQYINRNQFNQGFGAGLGRGGLGNFGFGNFGGFGGGFVGGFGNFGGFGGFGF